MISVYGVTVLIQMIKLMKEMDKGLGLLYKIGPSGPHYYFCFNRSWIIESYLEYQYTPV